MSIHKFSLALAVVALASSMPAAQSDQSAQTVQVAPLQHGHPFESDLRDLPHGLSNQHEKAPKGEEPPLGPDHGGGDSATQTSPGNAPTPPPGSGSGAGTFAGLDFQHYGAGWPPDTNGDVGPTYFIQTVNTSVGIFHKSDGALITAFSFDALMSQGNFGNACDNENGGDVTVVYDSGADRWIISDFAFATSGGNPVAPYFQCFAVSRTGDPVSGGWYFYSLQTNDLFPDYPKLGVWPDGLYLTANMFSTSFKNVRVWALNKAQMYAGAAATSVMFNLPTKVGGVSVFTAIPSTYHTATGVPPVGRPNFIASIWSAKAARVWKFHVDWANTANSTVTGPSNVTLASWTAASTSAPAKNGNGLDTLYERLMVQNQYTNLGGTESLWLTHTVANPGNTSLTAPRWYQLNVTNGTVVTSGPLQQSTFAPDASVGRWMPSLAVDKNGDMAIGYSAASSTLFPAIRYAGRLSTDPLSTLGQSETSLIEGSASQCCNFSDGTVNNRWGDYSGMALDPDGCTFWYTNEFYQSPQPTTLAADNWQTRIGSFKFSSCTPTSGTLQGTVTNSVTNAAIGGATVTAGSSSTTTDSSGQYTLGSLAPGTYSVTVSASSYTSMTVSATVSSGVATTQNFSLVSTGGTQASSTTVSSTLNPSTYGQPVTFTATVSPSSATGTVQFLDGTTSLGTAALTGGTAQLSTSALAAGSHSITATYSGDVNFSGSMSAIVTQTVDTQSTTTSVASNLNPSTYGQSVTFTATVSSTSATGTVQFLDGATSVGTAAVSGGTAQLSTSALAAGSHSITAKYSGDTNFTSSTSAIVTQTVNTAALTPTTTTLSSSLGSSIFGQNVTFTATVAPSAATGTVQFFDGAASLGTSALSAGTASLATSALAVGSHSITATYDGDSTFSASTSTPVSVTVAAGTRANVALASNGATALASSTYSTGYDASGAINGDRLGLNWGAGGGWNDGTANTWPDWLEIDFNGAQTIGEVDVFSVQDNFASPSTPTNTMTFTQYGLTDFEVQYWTGSAWATVPSGAISGNNLVWRQVTFAPLSTTKIRIYVTGALNTWSRITEVEAYTPGVAPPTNVALASNGAMALASSTYSTGYDASGAINGDRLGSNWGAGGGWNDGTADTWPDWLEIDFNGAQTIGEVDVFSVQDNFTSPSAPTNTMTFTQYGLTDFEIQYWTGSAWATVPNGAISGNNLVWRRVTFASLTTTKIRIYVTGALNTWSRVTEVEAYTP